MKMSSVGNEDGNFYTGMGAAVNDGGRRLGINLSECGTSESLS